jgi:VIT1/CCC1 family predicted Fe2+/Mn2+ transporter
MAAGEYVSVSAQSELIQRELAIERKALREHPDAERRELAAAYRRRGVDAADADRVAAALMADPDVALEVHAREELGVDPAQTGSPLGAALSSFIAFSIGALLPLVPWFFDSGTRAIVASVAIGVLASFGLGWTLAIFTGRSRLRSALRQLGIAVVAASVTYGVGALVGVRAV